MISRTSTQKYKSAPDNLRDVGSELGVANILEGSVQKIANAAHINVQLIRAATDEHLWAESYNRKLDDVFSVEGEVATTIAAQLDAKLTGAEHEALAAKPTQNLAAYDAYLRGSAIEHHRYGYEAYEAAAAEYARAVELDPTFALAWARLAVLRSFLYFNSLDLTANSAAKVKEAADKASALQPELAEAWVAQGAYRYRVQRDFAGALQAYQEAGKRLPNSALVYEYMAYVERRLGRWTEAELNYKKARELDPENLSLLVSEASEFLLFIRRYDEAQALLDRALQITPGDPDALFGKATLYQQQGRLGEAAAALARIPAENLEDLRLWRPSHSDRLRTTIRCRHPLGRAEAKIRAGGRSARLSHAVRGGHDGLLPAMAGATRRSPAILFPRRPGDQADARHRGHARRKRASFASGFGLRRPGRKGGSSPAGPAGSQSLRNRRHPKASRPGNARANTGSLR